MSGFLLPHLPAWAMPIGLAAHLAAGFGLGLLYFGSLWWNARLFAHAGRLRTMLGAMVVRLALISGVLTLVTLEGAMPLLTTALGLLIGRATILRRVRAVAS